MQLPTVDISLPDMFDGFNLSLPDIPPLPNVTLPDLLAGLQPPLRLPDLLGDININLGDLIPRLNIPNMPPMPTPFRARIAYVSPVTLYYAVG
jgi:hypothetical protein